MTPTLTVIGLTASVLCNLQNYDHSLRCTAPIDTFIVDERGEATGQLTSGVQFTQTNVANDYTRLQRFQLENYFHYVSDKGVIYAVDDLEALSKYLAI